jgi:hypothetical protein
VYPALMIFRYSIFSILACSFGLLLARELRAEGDAAAAVHRGGAVGWARLVTDDPHWRRHSRSDGDLSAFIRSQTSLNLDARWYSVAPARVEDLAFYPLIFSTDLTAITDPVERANLREYIVRGGFLLVDACINTSDVNPDSDVFLKHNLAAFRTILPSARIEPIPPDHELYRCYFKLKETPPHTYMNSHYDPAWAKHPLYGVYLEQRMVAVLSLSGLQCGWDHMPAAAPNHAEHCMQMVANIYVYAMTR